MKLFAKNYKQKKHPKANMEHRNVRRNGIDVERI